MASDVGYTVVFDVKHNQQFPLLGSVELKRLQWLLTSNILLLVFDVIINRRHSAFTKEN